MVDEKGNTGDRNTGDGNTGDWNVGDGNSGNRNTGDWNVGDGNSGNRNTGDGNSGDRNTGYTNAGDWNAGDYNVRDRNTGDNNAGYNNAGYDNAGNRNTGDKNVGDGNTGDWNTGHFNTGYFNTNEPKVRIFNKETEIKRENILFPAYLYFHLVEWVSSKDLSDKQKEEHPGHKILGGWLISYNYKEAVIKNFNKICDKEQAEQTIKLPNFNYEIFEEITGITKEMLDAKRGIITNETNNYSNIEIVINGIKYKRV